MGPSLFLLHSLTRVSFVIPEPGSLPPAESPAGDSALPGTEIPLHAHTHGDLAEEWAQHKPRAVPEPALHLCRAQPGTGHCSPAWQCPAQQGWRCPRAAGPSWQVWGHHHHRDPTPDSHLSYTIITELEAMQLWWRSLNSKRHNVRSRSTHLQRKWQDKSSPAELMAGSCPVAAVTNATLQQESLKTLSLLN